jgi:hypothetical protein
LFGIGQPHLAKKFDGALCSLCITDGAMHFNRFFHLVTAGKYRVQRAHGLLEDHGDLIATYLAQLIRCLREQVYHLVAIC